jgi:hypothetical protein
MLKVYTLNSVHQAILKLHFPYDQMIIDIDSKFLLSHNSGDKKIITGLLLNFSVYILNAPEMTISDLQSLKTHFLDYLNYDLINKNRVPVDVKSKEFYIQLDAKHKLFSQFVNNPFN